MFLEVSKEKLLAQGIELESPAPDMFSLYQLYGAKYILLHERDCAPIHIVETIKFASEGSEMIV